MFIRLRAHTCAYCHTIDEAHWKRHKEIAEFLLNIYETCGEVEWPITRSEFEAPERLQELDASPANSVQIDNSRTPVETGSSKRERKDAKKLSRASNRSKVVTQEEVQYIDSVLHLADGLWSSDSDGLHDPETIEEIEQHLHYHPHIHGHNSVHSRLRDPAERLDTGADFYVEVERILKTFRISELVQRNSRNKGLQGKELNAFHKLVDAFKRAIVEDLVLVKKDVLEIRMRRAGYLRYINKTAYGIVKDRYTDKDWKTGGKVTSSISDSSDARSSIEETRVLERYVTFRIRLDIDSHFISKLHEDVAPPSPPSNDQPDHRHLEVVHRRVDGDDDLYQAPIEPYHTPLLPFIPDSTSRKTPISLKIVTTKPLREPPEDKSTAMNAWGRNDARQQKSLPWSTVSYDRKPTPIAVHPEWASRSAEAHQPRVNLWSPDESEYPELVPSVVNPTKITRTVAPAVQALPTAAISVTNEPEEFEITVDTWIEDAIDCSPSTQKKAKKALREAKRKAKKVGVQEEVAHSSSVLENSSDNALDTFDMAVSEASTSPVSVEGDHNMNRQKTSKPTVTCTTEIDLAQVDMSVHPNVSQSKSKIDPESLPSPTTLPIVPLDKHSDWMDFTRYLAVDQLSEPLRLPRLGCPHEDHCIFEDSGVVDCPIHEPRKYLHNMIMDCSNLLS